MANNDYKEAFEWAMTVAEESLMEYLECARDGMYPDDFCRGFIDGFNERTKTNE